MTRDELLGLVRARHARGIRYVLAALRANEGNVQSTAAALGIGTRTLYRMRDNTPELQRGFAKHAQGRAGASRAGVMARIGKGT
jgi:hypothetical protein